MNTEIRIDNKLIFKDFDNHINIEGNNRILFSAPFGTGKSTFLTEYFEENTDKYFCFNLYPVNYSVSQNEDIFELIKFDLLLQLMGNYRNEIELKNEDFSNILSFQALFLKEIKLTPILLALLEEGGKIGKSAKILIDEVKKQYGNYKKQFNDEEKFIEQYLEQIENKVGNVNEMDAYSTIILNLLDRVEKKFPEKQSVLIIDDLDRLDPEHIFRLFNIFSLNFGKEEILNKFGFDKIIFVCDIENIRNIYAHKYGENVDFKGYIDKFFSYEPYVFDNEVLVKQKIESIVEESNGINFKNLKDKKYQLYICLKSVLMILLNKKFINLRTLISKKEIIIPNKNFNYNYTNSYESSEFEIVGLFNILKNYLGTFKLLEKVLDLLSKDEKMKILTSNHEESHYSNFENIHLNLYSLCLPFFFKFKDGKPINVNKSNEEAFVINVKELDIFIHYRKPFGINDNFFSVLKITKHQEYNTDEIFPEPFKMLNYTFKECVKRGAIVL